MKRNVSAFGFLVPLFAVLVFSVLLMGGARADETTPDGYVYTVSDGKATITGYTGTSTTLNIPSAVGVSLEYPVTAIGDNAFKNRTDLTGSVIIADSVTSIGERAFSGCNGLTGSLTIPDSVTSIGNYALNGCYGFTGSLTIGNSVTRIGSYAFIGCYGFTGSLTIPDSVTNMGEYSFCYCSRFTGNLTIGNSVTSIGNHVFCCCSGFTGSLVIPDSVTSIGQEAFAGCTGFTGSLAIPDSVTSIGHYAFYNCSGFTGSLVIPASVTSISDFAFGNCASLSRIYILSRSYTLGIDPFRDSAPDFYGYAGTPIQSHATNLGKTFHSLNNAVTGIVAVSGTSLKVTWSGVAGVTGYELWRSTSKTGTYKRVYAGTAKSFTSKSLKAGTRYYYKVRVFVTAGGVKHVGILGTAKAGVPLAKPKILSFVAAGSRNLKISWGKAAGATGYMLYQSASAKGTYKLIKTTTATSFTKTGLASGKQYFYKVKAYKKIGTVKYYGPLSAYKAGKTL